MGKITVMSCVVVIRNRRLNKIILDPVLKELILAFLNHRCLTLCKQIKLNLDKRFSFTLCSTCNSSFQRLITTNQNSIDSAIGPGDLQMKADITI